VACNGVNSCQVTCLGGGGPVTCGNGLTGCGSC
jgi:hypothetical protein